MLGIALVDIYAKCGVLSKSKQVFEELPIRNIGSWSALMSGYAQQGQGHEALKCQQQMQNEGFFPDEVTFVCFLSACGHSGLLNTAQMLFGNMVEKYGVTPNLEHHTCMVGILSRTGHLDKAMAMIKRMPDPPDHVTWHTVLYASRNLGNIECGKQIFDHVRR